MQLNYITDERFDCGKRGWRASYGEAFEGVRYLCLHPQMI